MVDTSLQLPGAWLLPLTMLVQEEHRQTAVWGTGWSRGATWPHQREWVGILRPALLCVLELCGPFPESLASRGSAGVWDSACVWVTFLDNYPPGAVAQEGGNQPLS